MTGCRDFHLVSELTTGGSHSTATAKLLRKPPLVVPGGVSYLDRDVAGDLRLTTAPAKQPIAEHFLLEPIWKGRQAQLLMISPPGARGLANGRAMPQLCLLGDGDEFQPDDDHLLHVLLFNRPDIGPVNARSVGVECPVCRSKICEGTWVYTCFNCGTAIHFQGDETPLETRLECAAVSDCPVCRAKISMAEGYSSDYPEASFG